MDFCARIRFSASSQIRDRGPPSITLSVTSSPRWAGQAVEVDAVALAARAHEVRC
jgi:hypothetical protein